MRCNHCFGTRRLWDAMLEEHSVGQEADRLLAASSFADAAFESAGGDGFGWVPPEWSTLRADARSAWADYESASARVRAGRGALQRAGGCLYGD